MRGAGPFHQGPGGASEGAAAVQLVPCDHTARVLLVGARSYSGVWWWITFWSSVNTDLNALMAVRRVLCPVGAGCASG